MYDFSPFYVCEIQMHLKIDEADVTRSWSLPGRVLAWSFITVSPFISSVELCT